MINSSKKKIFFFVFFVFFFNSAYSLDINYIAEDNYIIFKIIFQNEYSNLKLFEENDLSVITFDSYEKLDFQPIEFFDLPLSKVWATQTGNNKQISFSLMPNTKISPIVKPSPREIEVSFFFPAVAAKPNTSSVVSTGYLRIITGLFFIIILIAGSTYILRKFFSNTVSYEIPGIGRLLGKVHLDLKKQLFFYELGQKIYIISGNEQTTSLIDKISDPEEVTLIKSGFSRKKDFSSYMKLFKNKETPAEILQDGAKNIDERVSKLKQK